MQSTEDLIRENDMLRNTNQMYYEKLAELKKENKVYLDYIVSLIIDNKISVDNMGIINMIKSNEDIKKRISE